MCRHCVSACRARGFGGERERRGRFFPTGGAVVTIVITIAIAAAITIPITINKPGLHRLGIPARPFARSQGRGSDGLPGGGSASSAWVSGRGGSAASSLHRGLRDQPAGPGKGGAAASGSAGEPHWARKREMRERAAEADLGQAVDAARLSRLAGVAGQGEVGSHYHLRGWDLVT